MSELWNAQQREWLQAMGHTVLALAGDEPPPAAEPAVRAPASRGAADAAAGSTRPPPPRAREPAAAPARGPADEPVLLRNLLRAARRPSGDAQVLALFDAPALRGNAAAKRALWPRLRALRRGSARG